MGEVMVRDAIEAIYPLTPMQQGLLFHMLSANEHGMYVGQLHCTFHGKLDTDAFEKAWQFVVSRHSALRTSFVHQRVAEPRQVVWKKVSISVERLDWRDADESEWAERLKNLFAADFNRGFDLKRPPQMRLTLVQVDEEQWRFLWTNNHLVLDGWCLQLILREALQVYGYLIKNQSPKLSSVRQFRDYLTWLDQQDKSQGEHFWRSRLLGFHRPTPLPFDSGVSQTGSHSTEQFEVKRELPSSQTTAIQTLLRSKRLTFGTLLQGLWGVMLSHFSGENDVQFGVVASGRPADLPGSDSIVGLFINTLPVRMQIPTGSPLLTWLEQFQQSQGEFRQYEWSPLSQLREWSDIAPGSPLFESIVVFDNYPMDELSHLQLGTVEISDIQLMDRANYPLTLSAALWEGKLCVRVTADAQRFTRENIDHVLDQLFCLIGSLIENAHAIIPETLKKNDDLLLSSPTQSFAQEILVAALTDDNVLDAHVIARHDQEGELSFPQVAPRHFLKVP